MDAPKPDPGHREALAAAYDAHAADLYRYALMILGDQAGAEDAVQNAFAKLLERGRLGTPVQDYAAYLRTSVRHACFDLLTQERRHGERVELNESLPLLEPVDAGADPDELAALHAALRLLPVPQREVIYMKTYEGLTFQQIADATASPLSTVASRYRYGLETLRQHMASHGARKAHRHG